MSLGWGLSPTAPQGGVGLLGWRHLGQLTERKVSCVYFIFQNDSLTASLWSWKNLELPKSSVLPQAGLPPTSKKCKKCDAINDITGKTEQKAHFYNFLILHSSKVDKKVQQVQ